MSSLYDISVKDNDTFSFQGKKHTKEWKIKMSKRMSGENNPSYGKHHSEEWKIKKSEQMKGERNQFFGKHHSEESKNKIRNSNHLGTHPTEETREKLRKNNRGTGNPHFGKHHSVEAKLQISKKKTGVLLRNFDIRYKYLFDSMQNNELINGVLLSDGYLTNFKKGHSMMVLEQSKDHEELCLAFEKEMKILGFRCSIYRRSRTRTKTEMKLLHSIRATTEANYCFSLFREKWYPNDKKIVPTDMELTCKTLAYWFMGDGSSYREKRNDSGLVRINLATCSFTNDEHLLLIKKLKELGICKARKESNNTIAVFCTNEVIKFMNMIKPYILPCFKYKLKYPTFLEGKL